MNHNDKENVLLSVIDMVLIRHMIVYEKEIKKRHEHIISTHKQSSHKDILNVFYTIQRYTRI